MWMNIWRSLELCKLFKGDPSQHVVKPSKKCIADGEWPPDSTHVYAKPAKRDENGLLTDYGAPQGQAAPDTPPSSQFHTSRGAYAIEVLVEGANSQAFPG